MLAQPCWPADSYSSSPSWSIQVDLVEIIGQLGSPSQVGVKFMACCQNHMVSWIGPIYPRLWNNN